MSERVIDRDINSRIQAICDECFGGNVTKMAKASLVSRTTLLSIMGEQQSAPGYETLRRIIDMPSPRINIDWLLTGRGEMVLSGEEDAGDENKTGVPFYDVDFALGYEEMAMANETVDRYLNVPGFEKVTAWCRAEGRSMAPEINNGDLIALLSVDDSSSILYGEVYGIITSTGLRTVKRIRRSNTPGHIRLIPTNKEYDEQDIDCSQIIKLYRVLGAIKKL